MRRGNLQDFGANAMCNISTDVKLNANNKSHSRHFTVDFCKELGLNITELESDQTLQELVLSVHHAFIITIDATAATKLIENQNGARYITSQKK